MITLHLDEVPVNSDGLATHQHVASHHIKGVPGGAEQTLCGKVIIYSTWQGTQPGAPACVECEELDC